MPQRTVRIRLDVPVSIYRKLEERAATQGGSIGELILAGIKSCVPDGKPTRGNKVRFPLIRSKGPKIDLTNEEIYRRATFP
jgi:hypothetical protein